MKQDTTRFGAEEARVALAILGCVAYVCITLLLAGCQTTPPVRYEVKPFTLVVASPAHIQELWGAHDMKMDVCGFADLQERIIYVRYSRSDHSLPDFYVLGHELFHLRELGGWYHK